MESVINNNDLLRQIIEFMPLTEIELKRKRKIILEMKHLYCEWSDHNKYCFVCKPYHPLVINKRKKYMCEECCRIIQFYEALDLDDIFF